MAGISTRLRSLAVVFVFAVVAAACAPAAAPAKAPAKTDFPTKSVALISPFAAGSTNDLITRAVAEAATPILGQQVVVENKPGGTGSIGSAEVARARPDGYTLVNIGAGPACGLPFVSNVPYKVPDDFTPITHLAGLPLFAVAKSDGPYKDTATLIAEAKKNPGKITYGTSGQASLPHLLMERFQKTVGVKLAHVPFKAMAEAVTGVLGGHINLAVATPADIKGHVQAGTIVPLGLFSVQPIADFPNVKTFKAQGFDVVGDGWTGIAGPKALPQDVVAKLDAAFKRALESPTVRDTMAKSNLPIEYLGPADFLAKWKADCAANKAVVEELGLQPK